MFACKNKIANYTGLLDKSGTQDAVRRKETSNGYNIKTWCLYGLVRKHKHMQKKTISLRMEQVLISFIIYDIVCRVCLLNDGVH